MLFGLKLLRNTEHRPGTGRVRICMLPDAGGSVGCRARPGLP